MNVNWFIDTVIGLGLKIAFIVPFAPIFLFFGLIITAVGILIGNIYMKAQVSVKRELAVAKAPVIHVLSGAMSGLGLWSLSSHLIWTSLSSPQSLFALTGAKICSATNWSYGTTGMWHVLGLTKISIGQPTSFPYYLNTSSSMHIAGSGRECPLLARSSRPRWPRILYTAKIGQILPTLDSSLIRQVGYSERFWREETEEQLAMLSEYILWTVQFWNALEGGLPSFLRNDHWHSPFH
jgi:hypothetical protein